MKTTAIPANNKSPVAGEEDGRSRRRKKKKPLKPQKQRSFSFPTSNRFGPISVSSSKLGRDDKRRKGGRKKGRRREGGSSEWARNWVSSRLHHPSSYEDKVVVVSYNILGVENVSNHADLYENIPTKFLDWEWRKELICKEVSRYKAGILCFQEVDRFNELDNLLKLEGYRGAYKARTGEARDGCAIFWNENMFTLLHEETIEFQLFSLRHNVAQLCVFKDPVRVLASRQEVLELIGSYIMNENHLPHKLSSQARKETLSKNRKFVVGNIHVLFNPNRGDIKLGQMRIFLDRAYKLQQEWGSIPVIIGGDLNSLPQSAMYRFLETSELDTRLHSRSSISGQVERKLYRSNFFQNSNVTRVTVSMADRFRYLWNEEELGLATGSDTNTTLQHRLKLCSAYLGVPGSCRSRDHSGEPLATSYHSKFLGTVDYIWHSEDLVPVRVLETLPLDILRSTAGLPNERLGSDHLALVCELAFTDGGNRA